MFRSGEECGSIRLQMQIRKRFYDPQADSKSAKQIDSAMS